MTGDIFTEHKGKQVNKALEEKLGFFFFFNFFPSYLAKKEQDTKYLDRN